MSCNYTPPLHYVTTPRTALCNYTPHIAKQYGSKNTRTAFRKRMIGEPQTMSGLPTIIGKKVRMKSEKFFSEPTAIGMPPRLRPRSPLPRPPASESGSSGRARSEHGRSKAGARMANGGARMANGGARSEHGRHGRHGRSTAGAPPPLPLLARTASATAGRHRSNARQCPALPLHCPTRQGRCLAPSLLQPRTGAAHARARASSGGVPRWSLVQAAAVHVLRGTPTFASPRPLWRVVELFPYISTLITVIVQKAVRLFTEP
jgi:hypothetical protein